MNRSFETPGHRDLTPLEEENLLHIEEQMRRAEEESPARMMTHLDTFNDGVIAIIITIMVLELPVPESTAAVAVFFRSVGIFFLSFFIVANFWYEHHRIFASISGANHVIVVLDLCFLASLCLIPIMTKWLLFDRNSWSVVCYGTVYLVTSIIQQVILFVSMISSYRDIRTLFVYMFARSTGITLFLSVILIVLGWYYPEFVLPCFMILPITAFLYPRTRTIRWNGRILRYAERTVPQDDPEKPGE